MSHYNSAKLCAVIKREKEKEGKRHRREGTKYSERERERQNIEGVHKHEKRIDSTYLPRNRIELCSLQTDTCIDKIIQTDISMLKDTQNSIFRVRP